MENNARQIRLDREASRLEEAKREAQSLFDQVAIEILSNKSKTEQQRLTELDTFKSQAEANVPGLTLQYPAAYLVLKSRVSRPVSAPVAPATPITPTATAISAVAVAASPASPLTNSLGARDIPAEAAEAVRTNFELQVRNQRIAQAAKVTGILAAGTATAVAGMWAANKIANTSSTAAPATPPKSVAPAQPGSTASSVQPVNPSAPVLTVPAAPAAQPAPQPAVQPAAYTAPATPSSQNLDKYDVMWDKIKEVASKPIVAEFKKTANQLSQTAMEQYQAALRKIYPNNNIDIKGNTYGYHGTIDECKAFAYNVNYELKSRGYQIDNVKLDTLGNIPCFDDKDKLVAIYSISDNPRNLFTPQAYTPPVPQPEIKAAPAAAPVIAQASNPSPSVVQATPTIQTNTPAQATAAPIDDYNKLWNAINSAVNSEGSPLPKGKTFRLTDSQTNQLRQGLDSITGKVFTMGANNYGYMMMQGEDLGSCKAFAENAMKVFSGKLGGKVEDYAFIPCYGADKNLVAIYTLSNPIKEYKFTNNTPQQTSRNTGWQTQSNYQNQAEYNAAQNARGFYNWGNETEAKRLAAVERANDIRNGTVMPRFVVGSN